VKGEIEKNSRKSPEEIIDSIFEVLPVRSLITVDEIAKKINSNWNTVDGYLRLIQRVQEQPKVESMRIGTRRYGWRRGQK